MDFTAHIDWLKHLTFVTRRYQNCFPHHCATGVFSNKSANYSLALFEAGGVNRDSLFFLIRVYLESCSLIKIPSHAKSPNKVPSYPAYYLNLWLICWGNCWDGAEMPMGCVEHRVLSLFCQHGQKTPSWGQYTDQKIWYQSKAEQATNSGTWTGIKVWKLLFYCRILKATTEY